MNVKREGKGLEVCTINRVRNDEGINEAEEWRNEVMWLL